MVATDAELLAKIRLVLADAASQEGLVDAGRHVLDTQRGVMEKAAGLVMETIWKNSPSS